MKFAIVSEQTPQGDQPTAIEQLCEALGRGARSQVLLGVTGSGKTFTMAHVIARMQRPVLIMAPNKTLAAQLYNEFREVFPHNAVRYFVSYYDYYQPEAYVPQSDTYIAKDSAINDEIDKMRHSATKALLGRRDVIVVASVSCIYGLGSPESYFDLIVFLEENSQVDRETFIQRLTSIQYERRDQDFHRGTFRVRGDTIDVFPSYEDKHAVRLEFFGDMVERISVFDPVQGKAVRRIDKIAFYPASHYVTHPARLKLAILSVERELSERTKQLDDEGKVLEAQRLKQRTLYDLTLLREMGVCPGIENYSRHIDGRQAGQPPHTLLSYFPKDYLTFIDESHVTIPQIGGMYRADVSRKQNLVDHGFRLPSAVDNRPLSFKEFETRLSQCIHVSATPGVYEIQLANHKVIEQLIRPTGLPDPRVLVRPAASQVDDLLAEIRSRITRKERVLITTLTKKLAEELTDYYTQLGLRVRYLHSDIDTLERVELIRNLRKGTYDVLVGINLLREGLDLPEVSLVAVLDADQEGYLRSVTSLIQTIGRAARNVNGCAILYGDRTTNSMRQALAETERRRTAQLLYNKEYGITPTTIKKGLSAHLLKYTDNTASENAGLESDDDPRSNKELQAAMNDAARQLDFETAAQIRDQLSERQAREIGVTVATDPA